MNVYILDNFVPDDNTLKNKSSIDKLIISSHGMEMMAATQQTFPQTPTQSLQ